MAFDSDAPPGSGGHPAEEGVHGCGGAALEGFRLRVTFEAFCVTHQCAWTGFARTQVGSEQDAAAVVDAMKEHLARNWALALRQEILAAYAWRLLKEHIADWLAAAGDLRPALVQTAAFDAVVHHFRHRARIGPESLPEQIGLFTAILELPERQHDVVVLKYCLDLDDEKIAEYLGTPLATLRSNLRHARRRLARTLGRPDLADMRGEQ
ncbi:sigma factor-like helix-turn-helix DNA-binding protein [Kitasatospora sp. NPDC056138]|uniref:sigma factor-like helix-turn-helix DNA-binding protein n=1 Tax=Kitasatospora sp. NPDC056138 TaxID=3345724 RepID=UPI0035DD0EC6